MCGINGIIAKHVNGFYRPHADIFTHMVRMGSIRGDDSTGVFGITAAGNVDILKGDCDGYIFTRSKNYYKFDLKIPRKYRIVFSHNRAATKGDITAHNAHPFHEGNIVLVHNGTIFNSEALNKEAEVDSHAICHALNDHNAVDALGKINGAFALAWYNKKDHVLNLARNLARPLWLIETDDMWFVCSEPGLPLWLLSRQSAQTKPKSIREIPPEKILSFDLNALSKDPTEIAYEDYKIPTFSNTNIVPWEKQRKEWGVLPEPTTPIFEKPRVKITGQVGNLSIGTEIICTFQDYKDKEPAGSMIFVGHPVFDGEVDTNICVHYTVSVHNKDLAETMICENDFFTARISGYSDWKGTRILFVNTVVPIVGSMSYNGETFPHGELLSILAPGCPRCRAKIEIADVSKTIIRKKYDGAYRVLCQDCIKSSVINAKEKGRVELVH